MVKLSLHKNIADLFISATFSRINIEADCSLEQGGLLRDDGDGLAKLLKVDLVDVDSVNLDGTVENLDHSGKSHRKG